jgi:hypothetical protein
VFKETWRTTSDARWVKITSRKNHVLHYQTLHTTSEEPVCTDCALSKNTTKLAPELSNAARELASHLSNPGEEHWIELRKCVGYLRYGMNLNSIYRKPSELRSISTCDSNYAQDTNDRRSM